MIYNIAVVYATKDGNHTSSTFCECPTDEEAAVAAFKWVINRWKVWKDVCDIQEIVAIRVREYPVGKPRHDGFILSGDSLPFLDWTPKKTAASKEVREAIKPWVAGLRTLS